MNTIQPKFVFLISVFFYFHFLDNTVFELFQTLWLLGVSVLGGITLLINRSEDPFIKKFFRVSLIIGIGLCLSVIQSYRTIGQPIISGIIACYKYVLILGPVYLYVLFIKHIDDIKWLEKWLIAGVWLNFSLYILINIIYRDSVEFRSPFSNSLLEFRPEIYTRTFIIFGYLYYFLRYLEDRKHEFLILAGLLFFIPHLIELQRGQFLITVFLSGILLIRNKNNSSSFEFIGFLMVLVGGIVLVILFVEPFQYFFREKIDYFNEAIMAVLGIDSDDSSSQGRITQFLFMYEGLVNNFVLGNGFLRSSFIQELYGEEFYFHVSDLGPLGALYTFGLYSLVMAVSLYSIYRLISKSTRKPRFELITKGLVAYQLYLLLISIQTAKIIWKPHHFIMVSVLIFLFTTFKIDERIGKST
ncbi:hypothetical protein [Ekhidna sp.]|uniref:hypothetical protein n=1 Tax=Ekhidna sp. TaxID=2608089 RepID=UPI003B5C28BA